VDSYCLFMASSVNHSVYAYDDRMGGNREPLLTLGIGEKGKKKGNFDWPRVVCVINTMDTSQTTIVAVTDFWNHRVQLYSL
jgi:hypothetical protein